MEWGDALFRLPASACMHRRCLAGYIVDPAAAAFIYCRCKTEMTPTLQS
jgi:hypothetical protein